MTDYACVHKDCRRADTKRLSIGAWHVMVCPDHREVIREAFWASMAEGRQRANADGRTHYVGDDCEPPHELGRPG